MQAGRAKADRSLENSCTRKTPRARLQSPARYDNLRPEVVPCAGAYTAPCSDRDRAAGPQASTAFRMPEEGRPPPSLRWRESGPQRSPWRQAASLQRSPGLTLHAGGCRMCPLNWKKGNPRPGRKGDLPPMHQPVHQPPTWLTKRPHQFLFKLASGFSRVASTQREGGPSCCPGLPGQKPRPLQGRPLRHPRPLTCHHLPAALTPPRPEASSLKHKPDNPSLALLPSFLPSLGLEVTASKPAPAPALAQFRSSRFSRLLRFWVWLRALTQADVLPARRRAWHDRRLVIHATDVWAFPHQEPILQHRTAVQHSSSLELA